MILVAPINGPSEMILSAANIGIARGIGRDHWALPYDLKHGNYLPSLWEHERPGRVGSMM